MKGFIMGCKNLFVIVGLGYRVVIDLFIVEFGVWEYFVFIVDLVE